MKRPGNKMHGSNLLHKFLIFIPTLLFSVLIYYAGIYVRQNGYYIKYLTDILIVTLCAVFIVSFILSLQTKKVSSPKLPLKTVFFFSYLYCATLFFLLLLSIFLCGIAYKELATVHFLFALFAVYTVYRLLHAATIRLEAATDCTELDKSEYSKLFEITEKAASTLGITEKIRMFVQMGFPLSVASIDGEVRVIIGTHIPALLTEFEFEAMIVAEMGLIKYNSPSVDAGLKKKYTHWKLAFDGETNLFPNFFLIFPLRQIESKVLSVLENEAINDENIRNDTVIQFGIPTDYLNGTAKLTQYNLFLKTPPAFSIYENPKPPRDFQERLFAEYTKEGAPRFEKTLKTAMLNTVEGGFGTSLKNKLEFFGLEDVISDSVPLNQSYISEGDMLLKLGNDLFADSFHEDYDEMRNHKYLTPKATTDSYESDIQNGKSFNEAELFKIAISYILITEYRKAENIFDEILARNPANDKACLEKGILLLSRFDESGVPLVLKVTEKNRLIALRAYISLINYYRCIGNTETAEQFYQEYRLLEAKEEIYRSKLYNIRTVNDFSPVALSVDDVSDIREYCQTHCPENKIESIILSCRKLSDNEIVNLVFVRFFSEVSCELKEDILYDLSLYFDNRNEHFHIISYEQYPRLYHIAEMSKNSVLIFRNTNN